MRATVCARLFFLIANPDVCFRGANSVLMNLAAPNFHAGHFELLDLFVKDARRQAEIQQAPEHHVACDSGKGIEVSNPHDDDLPTIGPMTLVQLAEALGAFDSFEKEAVEIGSRTEDLDEGVQAHQRTPEKNAMRRGRPEHAALDSQLG